MTSTNGSFHGPAKHPRTRGNISLAVCLLWLGVGFASPLVAAAQSGDTRAHAARQQLRARDFAAAIETVDTAVRANPQHADTLLYLKALAQFYRDDFAGAVATTSSVINDNPESAWSYKARFLQAQAFARQKQFKAAEAIYAEEANRLLADTRKQEIAGVIIGFADRLAAKPAPDALDAPPPDFGKAYSLYNSVLQMEIGRDVRDSVMFRKARAIQEAGNPQQAIHDFQAYLAEFDPRWSGPAGSSAERKENPPPAGQHVRAARYFLALALRDAGRLPQSRWEARDLLARMAADGAEHDQLHADTQWLVVTAFRMPTPAVAELERAVKATEAFLAAHPADARAVQAAYFLPQAYEKHRRHETAIAQYQRFIDGSSYTLPTGDAATQPMSPDERASPTALRDRWQKEALYKIGQICFAQKQYRRAIEIWTRYTNRFPDGPHWSASQTGLLHAAFQQGVQALAEEEYETARTIFEAFLHQHPLDARARQILFVFGQIHYALAVKHEQSDGDPAESETLYEQAIDDWRRLISKYPQTEEASLALFRIGTLYEEKLGQLENALDAYRRLTWGAYAGQARQRIQNMTTKELQVTTERKFRTDETPAIRIACRNIKAVTVQTYRLNLEAYFRKMHTAGGVEGLDVSLIEPDKTWEIQIENYAKYQPLTQDVEIPFADDAPGAFVVNVSEDDWEATTLVIRSDLDLISKTSRRQALVFVQNMRTDTPANDTKVLLSNGQSVFATGNTGKDGVFTGSFDELNGLERVGILAVRDGHIASHHLNLDGLQLSSGLVSRGYIYTDRPVYRPGQSVAVRGILRDVTHGSYSIPDGRFRITVEDPQGRMIREEQMALSAFGSFRTALTLPDAAALGLYTVQASLERDKLPPLLFSGSFQVQHFTLEKIRLAVELERDVYFRGETIAGSIRATYYWGEPVANAPLRYLLPDGRAYNTQTDKNGAFSFTFDSSALRPGQWLQVSASLPVENVSADARAFLGTQGFYATVKPSQPLIVAGEPVDVTVTTTGADQQPVGRDLTISVLRRIPRREDRVLDMIPWLAPPESPPAEVQLQEHTVSTDPETGLATITLKLAEGGPYILRAAGSDRFGQTVTADGTLQVSSADDDTRLRLFADSAELDVGETARIRLHARMQPALALLTYEGENILRYEVMRIANGYNPIAFEVGHDLFPNVRISAAAMDGRRLRVASKDFSVKRQLHVKVRPLKESYLPGANGQVEITVTDQLGNPVEAELSLALVNEALFALYPDQTPPILDFFQDHARRHAEFRVGTTCGFSYTGITREVITELLEEEERLTRRAGEAQRLQTLHAQQGDRFNNAPQAAAAEAEGFARLERMVGGADQAMMLDEPSAIPQLVSRAGTRARRQDQNEPSAETAQPRREVAGAGVWLPAVVTDAAGQAIVTVPMPDTTTEWRLTARGCTPETLVGEATAHTLTRKDFFVEIKTAPMVREGDQLQVLARIHNRTDYEGPVSVKLTVTAGNANEDGTLAHRQQDLQISAHGSSTYVFPTISVPLVEALTVQVSAALSASTPATQDSLVRQIPVQPWGMEYADHGGGIANADATALLALPEHAYSRRWLSVTVAPVIEQAILDLALSPHPVPMPGPRITRYGYNPGSELLAAVRALTYGRRGNVAAEQLAPLTAKARRLAATLVVSQRGDGGWSWHGDTGEATDWPSSSRAYWALAAAQQAGIGVNPDTLEKAAQYLETQFHRLGANDHEAKAVVLHALSVQNKADFANLNRLYRARHELGNTALSYTALAFLNLKRPEIATELAGMLEARFARQEGEDGSGKYLPHRASYPYLQDDLESTALALLLLARTKPESGQGAAAAQFLMQRRGCFGWQPGKVRGPAIAALTAWFGSGMDARSDYRVRVSVNGKPVGTVDSTAVQHIQRLDVPDALLQQGENRVTFRMAGRGTYAYAATLRGFSPQIKNPATIRYPHIRKRHYYHAQRAYRGRPIGVQSTSPVRHLESGQRVDVYLDIYERSYQGYLVIEEPLPAGTMLVEGSVSGDYARYEVGHQKITFYYRPNQYIHDIRYQLVGYAPGDFRVLPTVIRDALHPDQVSAGAVGHLAVLPPGVASDDPYKMNRAELFKLGQLHFADGLYGQALAYLAALYQRDHDYNEQELARMLLWIYTTPALYEAARIVEMFEILRERYPELEVPYDKILVVGQAYRDIGEFERAWLVFRATIAGSFVTDSNLSAVLEDQGRFLGSVAYQQRLWREYPDSAAVVASYFAISQALYSKAPHAADMPEEQGHQPDRISMLQQAADILTQFLTLYPLDPLADDAAFSLANAMLDLKNYPLTVELSERFRTRYSDSPMTSSFQYMAALGHFWQHHFEDALQAAVSVAEGDSKDKTFAQYIVGQIYHARNNPENAIAWYEKVAEHYPDAAQAIAYFEKKDIQMDEVTVFRPGEQIAVALHYRNLKDVYLQIYRVDLMKLYLQQKNLSDITQIQLAGIRPERELVISLGDGKDYADQERQLDLALEQEGAYLVICRGGDLFTSGLVLITPLALDVQQDARSGRVRVHVRDTIENAYQAEVHVKAIGSADQAFRDGETDLRGVFVADNLRGAATVIARDAEARYAFYRGKTWLGAPRNQPASGASPPTEQPDDDMDFQYNLRQQNSQMQQINLIQFEQMRRTKQQGVKVKAAF